MQDQMESHIYIHVLGVWLENLVCIRMKDVLSHIYFKVILNQQKPQGLPHISNCVQEA